MADTAICPICKLPCAAPYSDGICSPCWDEQDNRDIAKYRRDARADKRREQRERARG